MHSVEPIEPQGHSSETGQASAANFARLSLILKHAFNPKRGTTKIGDLVDELDHHGMAVILILFSIPSALPLPAAGYSTVLSIPLFAIGIRLALARDTVWFPESIRRRTFDPAGLSKLMNWMLWLVEKLERVSRPRLVKSMTSRTAKLLLGLLICALACSMALPIPGTNTLPAGGIFLIGFGLLEHDGLLILGGVIYSLIALCVSVAVIFLGYEVVKQILLNLF